MEMLLLTVDGPRRRIDLEIPGEVSIHDLLPSLLRLCGPQPLPAAQGNLPTWELGLEGREPLGTSRTLIEAGVMDGAVLFLRDDAWWFNARHPSQAITPPAPPSGKRTGGIGIEWVQKPRA